MDLIFVVAKKAKKTLKTRVYQEIRNVSFLHLRSVDCDNNKSPGLLILIILLSSAVLLASVHVCERLFKLARTEFKRPVYSIMSQHSASAV